MIICFTIIISGIVIIIIIIIIIVRSSWPERTTWRWT